MLRSLTLISLLVSGALAGGANYDTLVTVADVKHAGTDSDILIRYHGENGPSTWMGLQLKGINDLERGRTYHYNHDLSIDVGQVSIINNR